MDVKITFNDFTVTGANQLNNVTIKLLKGEKGDPGEPTDAQVQTSVNTWLAAHPEATTTVQDGAISYAKLDSTLKAKADDVDDLKSSIDLGSITPEVKTALLACFENVVWINDDGQDYVNALHDALYNRYWEVTNNLTNCTTSNESVQTIKSAAYTATITASAGYIMSGATVSIMMGGNDITSTAYSNGVISIPAVTGALVITISAAAKPVSSISAVYTQSGTVYDTDTLDSLKTDLVVTATYDDSSSAVVTAYTLSGTLAEGTSTITVGYGGKTTTFTVTVIEEVTTTMFSGYNDSNSSTVSSAGPYALKYNSAYTYDYTKEVCAIKLNVVTAGNLAICVIPLTSFSGNSVNDEWEAIVVKDNLTISETGMQTVRLNSPFKVPEDNVLVIGTGNGEFPIEPTSTCLWKYGSYGTQKGFGYAGGSSGKSLGVDIIVR